LPVFEALYKSVRDGSETRRSLEFNSRKTYREDLQKELDVIDNQEIWRAGKTVRRLRVSSYFRVHGHELQLIRHSPTPTRTSFNRPDHSFPPYPPSLFPSSLPPLEQIRFFQKRFRYTPCAEHAYDCFFYLHCVELLVVGWPLM
jgi:hypothetical protein